MVGMTLENAKGAVLWRGASRLDGAPIVVVATGLHGESTNEKTGAMVQTWILRADVHPVVAVNDGSDEAICGQCPLRPMLARAVNAERAKGDPKAPQCYVNKGFGPAAVYKSMLRGIYPDASPRAVRRLAQKRGLAIRFGAYGDPGAVPLKVWRDLESRRHTGYSHQWKRFSGLRALCMASADSLQDAREAWRRGWRTFRVIRSIDELQPNEILCPASAEGGRKTTCHKCGLCSGATASDRRKSIAIIDHGPTAPRGRKLSTV
jgi:hypothetical protein